MRGEVARNGDLSGEVNVIRDSAYQVTVPQHSTIRFSAVGFYRPSKHRVSEYEEIRANQSMLLATLSSTDGKASEVPVSSTQGVAHILQYRRGRHADSQDSMIAVTTRQETHQEGANKPAQSISISRSPSPCPPPPSFDFKFQISLPFPFLFLTIPPAVFSGDPFKRTLVPAFAI